MILMYVDMILMCMYMYDVGGWMMDGWIWMDVDVIGRCKCHWKMYMSLVDVHMIGRCKCHW